jgi:peptidoglycan/xylan/chitin deacetylase (PgdA/CDA1 family)
MEHMGAYSFVMRWGMRAKQYLVVWLTVLFVGGVFAIGGALHPATPLPIMPPVSLAIRPVEVPLPPTPTLAPATESTVVPQVATPVVDSVPPSVSVAAGPASTSSPDAHIAGAPAVGPTPITDTEPIGVVTDVPEQLTVSSGQGRRAGGVPILMYHYIRVNPVASDTAGYILSVAPNDFNLQMQFLAERGYHTVTMAAVREFVRNGTPLPSKPIALTFDDGYDDAFTAAKPILDRYGMTATFYIVTGFLDHLRYMTWDQVIALDQDNMEIGAHTVHHVGLTMISGAQRRYELTASQADLEARLGHDVLDFCYPGGEVDAASEISVRQAGYLSATTTAYGFAEAGDDALHLPRIRVSGGEGMTHFASLLEGSIGGIAPRLVRPSGPSLPRVSVVRSITPTLTPTPTVHLLTPTPSPPTATSTATPRSDHK